MLWRAGERRGRRAAANIGEVRWWCNAGTFYARYVIAGRGLGTFLVCSSAELATQQITMPRGMKNCI